MSRKPWNWLILFGVAALIVIADRFTKSVVANSLSLYEVLEPPIVEHFFRITYTTNTGAAFGLFPGHSTLFVFVSIIVIVVILLYYRQLPEGYTLARVALGLQLGGTLGNLIDRLLQGYVVDFLGFNFWPLVDWPYFNVADSAMVVGVCLLALAMLREDLARKDDEAESSEGGATSEQRVSS